MIFIFKQTDGNDVEIESDWIEDAVCTYRCINEDICRMKGDPVIYLCEAIEFKND